LLKTLYFELGKKKKGLWNWGVGFWERCRGVLGGVWNAFGTRLEQAWNIVGTIYIDFEGVTRIRGTSGERAWNLGKDLGGFCSFFLLVHENMNAGKT